MVKEMKTIRLTDVCLASSAAPIYRSLALVQDPNSVIKLNQKFADGALWANNPVMVALLEAITITNWERPIEIYSLGTCPRPGGEVIEDEAVHKSLRDWFSEASLLPLAISAQDFAFENMARLFSEKLRNIGQNVHVIRFPYGNIPANMMQYLDLDDSSEEAMGALISQARSDADKTRSICQDSNNPDGKRIIGLLNSLPIVEL